MDLEYWEKLYKKNPKLFEEKRKEYLKKYIEGRKNEKIKDRLTKLQWRIDMERIRCKTPLKSLLKINDMMWDSFLKLNEKLQEFSNNK